MRSSLLTLSTVLALSTLACDAKKEDSLVAAKTKGAPEPKQTRADTRTPEELEKARKEAGFTNPDDAAKANIAAMEKGEREYVKTRLAAYREMVKNLRAHVDSIDKGAQAWAKAKDPQKAFDKFAKGYKKDVKSFKTSYGELTEHGSRGGNLAALIGKTLRTWENVNNDLSPEISKAGNFAASVSSLRTAIDEIEADLTVIDKDESLKISGATDDGAKKNKKAG